MTTRPLFVLLFLAACGVPDLDEDGHDAASDCNDADANVHPGASEICNGVDDDCNGIADDNPTDGATWYNDADSDGYGDADTTVSACLQPAAHVANADDCDDSSARFHPGASEWDCTDTSDYNCDGSVGFADADSDGAFACQDCNDALASVKPGATETCNDVDDDCDGVVDDSPSDATSWALDADGDGHGSKTISVAACDQPVGTVAVASADDCDDYDRSVHPGATEVCDGVDDDCNNTADDGWNDEDADTLADCVDLCPAWVAQGSDGDGSRWAPFGSISDALAGKEAGCNEVIVMPGTYYGSLDLADAEVHVRSWMGPEATVLDGLGEGATVVIAGGQTAATILEGFTVTGGTGELGDGRTLPGSVTMQTTKTYGGGVFVLDSSPILRDLIVTGNVVTDFGGGISAIGGDTRIEDAEIVGNQAEQRGGGLFLGDGNPVVVSTRILQNNAGNSAGGVHVRVSTQQYATFDGVWIEDNGKQGLYAVGGRVRMTDSVVYNNEGTGLLGIAATLRVAHTTFVQNGRQSAAGYGIDFSNSSIDIDACLFYDNRYYGARLVSGSGAAARSVFLENDNGTFLDIDDGGENVIAGGDPFVDLAAADFRPSPCSVANDLGTNAVLGAYPLAASDFDGVVRSSFFDAGSFQAPDRNCPE